MLYAAATVLAGLYLYSVYVVRLSLIYHEGRGPVEATLRAFVLGPVRVLRTLSRR